MSNNTGMRFIKGFVVCAYFLSLVIPPVYAQPPAQMPDTSRTCASFPDNAGAFYLRGNSIPGDPGERALQKFSTFYATPLKDTDAKTVLGQSAKARLRYLPFLTHEIFTTVTGTSGAAPTQGDTCLSLIHI